MTDITQALEVSIDISISHINRVISNFTFHEVAGHVLLFNINSLADWVYGPS